MKTEEELAILYSLKMNYLYIGTETGSEEVLRFANKGHTVDEAIEACRRLDRVGIRYSVVYISGLAGTGKGIKNARESAAFFNQTNPVMIGVTSLSIYQNSTLGKMYQAGTFQRASELEMLEETRELLAGLNIHTLFSSIHVSNICPLQGMIPEHKEEFMKRLDETIAYLKRIGDTPRYQRDGRM